MQTGNHHKFNKKIMVKRFTKKIICIESIPKFVVDPTGSEHCSISNDVSVSVFSQFTTLPLLRLLIL